MQQVWENPKIDEFDESCNNFSRNALISLKDPKGDRCVTNRIDQRLIMWEETSNIQVISIKQRASRYFSQGAGWKTNNLGKVEANKVSGVGASVLSSFIELPEIYIFNTSIRTFS